MFLKNVIIVNCSHPLASRLQQREEGAAANRRRAESARPAFVEPVHGQARLLCAFGYRLDIFLIYLLYLK